MAAFVAVGVALAALTPFSPWYALTHKLNDYTLENTTFQLTVTSTLYPGSDWRYHCTSSADAPGWAEFCPRTWSSANGISQSYALFGTSAAQSSRISALYGALWSLAWLPLVAGIGSLGGLVLLLHGRGGWRLRTGLGLALACAAVVSLGMVSGVGLLQPPAIAHADGVNQGGPSATFWGACGPATDCEGTYPGPNGTLAVTSASWGPSFGWFFQLVAGVLFLIAALATLRAGRHLQRTSGTGGSSRN